MPERGDARLFVCGDHSIVSKTHAAARCNESAKLLHYLRWWIEPRALLGWLVWVGPVPIPRLHAVHLGDHEIFPIAITSISFEDVLLEP